MIGAGVHILGDKEPYWVGELNEMPDRVHPSADELEKDPNSEGFLLFPPRLLGYSTKEKMWGQFGVDQTKPAPGKKQEMFDQKLQLEPRYKQMIQALVQEHVGGGEVKPGERTQVEDIVKDKGKGLVLLLHGRSNHNPTSLVRFLMSKGPPGVGKTVSLLVPVLFESYDHSNIRTSAYCGDHRPSYWQASLHCKRR